MPLILFGKGVQNDAHCNCIVPPWRHACDRNGKDNNNSHFWKQNMKVGRLKHGNKRRSKKCYVLIKKRHMKGEKHLALMDFAEYLRKWDILGNSKSVMEDFYKIDFMKIIAKNWMRCTIFWKICYNHGENIWDKP